MRILGAALLVFAAACGSGRAVNVLCAYCTDDTQCGGNPCFEDVSGNRFCGSPCDDGCPTGFSCAGIYGTDATRGVIATCFPDNEQCILNVDGGVPFDAETPLDDGGGAKTTGVPVGGAVGPTGGTVDHLFFGITGDTRPDQCGGIYPQTIIDSIFTQLAQKQVDFVLDQGDHMFNCGSTSFAFSGAQQQMQRYVNAANKFGRTVFMTLGNHECSGEASRLCSAQTSYGTNPNYTAFMDALAPISPLPYYRFDVQTRGGLAVFLVVADDTWDFNQQQWLTAQLKDADAHAKYTFVSKHHPDGNTDHPEFQQIYDLVTSHKYTLFFTGHSHLFKRQFGNSRALVVGIGGAPLAGGDYWGYGTVEQGTDDRIAVTIYDQQTGTVQDSFSVAPQ
jgi:Calcineurin-like phosphoesterase